MDIKDQPESDNTEALTAIDMDGASTDTPLPNTSEQAKTHTLQSMLEAFPVPAMLFADDQSTLFLNPAFAEVVGYTVDDIPSAQVFAEKAEVRLTQSPNGLTSWADVLADVGNGKTATNLVLHLRSQRKEDIHAICSIVPLQLEAIETTLAILVDMTAQAHALEALNASSKVLQAIIETIPMKIFWKDKASRFLGCNMAFARDAGVESPEQIIGRTDYDLVWKQKADAYRADDRSIMDERKPRLGLEMAVRNDNGELEYLRTARAPLQNEAGEVIGVLGLYEDITEQKRLYQELELTHVAINKSQTSFFWLNAHGRVIYVNDYACDSLGYSREELTGKYVWDFDPDVPREGWQEVWDAIRKNGQYILESRHRRADGSMFPVEVTANYILTGDEEQSFVFVQDITERRRLTARERTRNEVLEMIARGAPLATILERLVRGTEAEDPEKLCSILLLDEEGQRLLNYLAPSLPDFYNNTIHGLQIGPQVGSCGTAAKIGERVIVEDIANHPYWEGYKELAAQAGLGACWSQPILTASDEAIGTFALYHRTPKTPSEMDLELMEFLVTLAGIAIERDRTVEALKLSASVYENSSEGMMVTDTQNRIVAVNPAFTRISGYTLPEVRGQTPAVLGSGRQGPEFYESLWSALDQLGHWQGEVWERRKDGEEYLSWLAVNTIYHDNGEPSQRVALFSDITEKKKTEELIWQQANFDALTHLPNRRMFRERLEQEIRKVKRNGLSLALLFIDLDRFKEVNDTVGHSGGDQLLQEAARRIATCVRETDTVARLGGDEFTVILTNLSDIRCINRVAEDILDSLAMPFQLEAETMYISASLGITIYPNDAKDIDELIQNADQAMYVAKGAGKNRFSFFTPSMQMAAHKRLQLTKDLRIALSAGQLELYYQPIIHLPSGKVHKAEALLRWNHPELGWVSPGEFIPVAEDSGLIHTVGDWVFREAALQVKEWQQRYHVDFQISVNQSPLQFRVPSTLEYWLRYLNQLNLSGKAIAIEITEGVLLDATESVTTQLLKLRDAGVQVAIDDFGTGYSSLNYLNKLDIDYLKIDQSFTRNLQMGSSDMALSEAIVVMAHKLGLQVIAEGVETDEQRALLMQAGCDYAQGYLFSRPLPAQAFEQWLDSLHNSGNFSMDFS